MSKFAQLTLIVVLLYLNPLYAQKPVYNKTTRFINGNKVWAFARNTGVDFNSGTPKPIVSSVPQISGRVGEGAAAVSDPATGKLLFYSDGQQCWTADHVLMPNGDGLLGNVGTTSMQGACIVPVIGAEKKYYLFSLEGDISYNPTGKLYYNIIDMSLNGGKGDIVSGKKNIKLDEKLSEVMMAIPGNNCDIWLVVHSYGATDSSANGYDYKAYHITQDGIDPNPVLSQGKVNLLFGTMCVSPDRSKIATIGSVTRIKALKVDFGGTEVVKFDPNTGKVSEPIVLPVGNFGPAVPVVFGQGGESIAFSPDNTKLYCDEAKTTRYLLQFDVSKYDSGSVAQSQIAIDTAMDAPYVRLRLYNDTIYIVGFGQTALSVINRPNVAGTGCGFKAKAVSLNGAFSMYAAGTEVVFPYAPDTVLAVAMDTILDCNGWDVGALDLEPSNKYSGYSYKWSDASTDTLLKITEDGIYWVTYDNNCNLYADTFKVSSKEMPNAIIQIDVQTLRTSQAFETYQWLFATSVIEGATERDYIVNRNGDYQVVVSNTAGCFDTSDVYKVTNVSVDELATWESNIKMYPNPSQHQIHISAPKAILVQISSLDGRVLMETDQAKSVDISSLPDGLYLVKITAANGDFSTIRKLVKANLDK